MFNRRPSAFIGVPQDFAWLALFTALALATPERNDAELEILAAFFLFQVLEPRITSLQSPRGAWIAVLTRLALSYLLIGVTGGVTSSFYLILLIPIISAATLFGPWSTAAVYLLAIGSYLSFLALLDWSRYTIPPDQARELAVRCLLLGMVAYLTHQLGRNTRHQTLRYQAAAQELAAANRSLQDAEATVRRSERLAALGQLTAGLAHELRNPLGTMKASAELLERNVTADPATARELSGYIATEVDRLNALITRFLDFSRPLELRRERADLHEVLDRAAAELDRHKPPFKVTIHRNYSPEVKPFPLDAVLLERVFYNLLLNAAQASQPGALITLKTRTYDSTVEASVTDRGSGIPAAQLENIFNPFFTTKPTGVGLGLAVVSRIVDEHGGRMSVESTPGEGSIFRVLLPA